MKRRTVSEREDAQAREAAAKHRGDLLADLRAREVARRASPTAPEPVVSPCAFLAVTFTQ